ncbi:putative amidoligase enzyme-domain-containing protein [Hypoxylon rubiginosum]|uniref:Amidoligase enzyme-domain-containing protein n=1 Tax=Hypoxylon rubiginosum TaxID=110542 RepID=A0ACC0DJB4_9PEZI|nr:putative amidoligase enzyme-domain-containing protein [Hypoxylon rubiginosum]
MASSSLVSSMTLAFGLEMEFFVRPHAETASKLAKSGWNAGINENKDKKTLNRNIIREAVARSIRDNGVPAGVARRDYGEWSVIDEPSLDEFGDYWRVEIVSRVLSTADEWQIEVERVFGGLVDDWDINLTTGCSMHIHVSTGTTNTTRFTTDQVRRIIKGIAFYEEAITKIMPADRKNNEWAMSNFKDPKTPAALKQAYAAVPTATWAPLFAKFDGIKMKEMVYRELGENKYLSWNFYHLSLNCGTIEFRRPPGVRSATDAKHWAGVALGFVSQALVTDYTREKSFKQYPPVNALVHFIAIGAQRLGSNCKDAVNLAALKEDRSAATVHTAREMQVIARKKTEKDKHMSPFVEKVSKPALLKLTEYS